MKWRLERDQQNHPVLHLAGQLTVEHAEELRQVLLEAMAAGDDLIVELDPGLEADITGLQLLCSAHRTFMARHKKITLHRESPPTFRRMVEEAGLLRHQGCVLNPHDNCLWIGGNL